MPLEQRNQEMSTDRYIREKERREITGLSRPTWWRLSKKGLAPRSYKLSANACGWFLSEITEWMNSRKQSTGSAQ